MFLSDPFPKDQLHWGDNNSETLSVKKVWDEVRIRGPRVVWPQLVWNNLVWPATAYFLGQNSNLPSSLVHRDPNSLRLSFLCSKGGVYHTPLFKLFFLFQHMEMDLKFSWITLQFSSICALLVQGLPWSNCRTNYLALVVLLLSAIHTIWKAKNTLVQRHQACQRVIYPRY